MPKPRPARLLEEEFPPGIKRTAKDITEAANAPAAVAAPEILDLGLELGAAWLRDLAALASGAAEVVFDRDRLSSSAPWPRRSTPPAPAARRRRLSRTPAARLDLNVSEELALEALFYRLGRTLDDD